MSRQMAFQMTVPQLVEAIRWITAAGTIEPGTTLGDWLDRHITDPLKRQRINTAFIVVDKCRKAERDINQISKVIVWRDAEGKPSDIQIEFKR